MPGEWPPLSTLLQRRLPRRLAPLTGQLAPLVILLLLVFFPVPLLYVFLRSARVTATRIFRTPPAAASAPGHDETVDRVKKFRTWVAIAVSVAIYAIGYQNLRDILSDGSIALLVTPWLLIATAPVVVSILILCAPAHRRRPMRTAVRGPLRKLACYIGTIALVPAALALTSLIGRSPLDGWPTFAGLIGIIWSLCLFLFSSATVVQTGFGVAAVHPALPALLTSILVWELALFNGLPAGPPPLAYAMLIGGPTTVTALSWWEIHRLRTRSGVTLRHG
ncbi:hypothetical protein [Streptomyces sp. NPDC058045]|uniref:hypothetical protein n=1 Tax=Streptomyces sp. NPDC058045 TaxID=3346311 RepID=UPI0036E39BB6